MNTIKKYIVCADYRKFEFEDGDSALEFAQIAAQTGIDIDCVEIRLIIEEPAKEEENVEMP